MRKSNDGLAIVKGCVDILIAIIRVMTFFLLAGCRMKLCIEAGVASSAARDSILSGVLITRICLLFIVFSSNIRSPR